MNPIDPIDPTDDVPDLEMHGELIDGHTIEELADYVAAGRTPADPSIDASPASRQAVSNLMRLTDLTSAALVREAEESPPAKRPGSRPFSPRSVWNSTRVVTYPSVTPIPL